MRLPESDRLDISAFEQILSPKYLTNSYKLFWFSAIFDEIREQRIEISFVKIVLLMICKSWHPIITYRLNFGFMDKLNDLVLYIYERYRLKRNISQGELFSFLEQLNDAEFAARITDLYRYVPYRLISPFFPELKNTSDNKKNKIIEELSMISDRAIYSVNNSEKKIIVHQNWYEYIYKNQVIISGWYYYKLIFFLQLRNPSVPALPFKIEAPLKRSLDSAKSFWIKIIKCNSIKDIYTDRPITSEGFSIDHFIPWSFVLHDLLWNLVPTFKDINSSKCDNLPDFGLYLDKFCQLQYLAFSTARKERFPEKFLGDYYEISRDITISREIPRKIFVNNLKSNLIPLFQLAHNLGFPIWKVSQHLQHHRID